MPTIREERGQVAVLILGLTIVVMAVIGVAVDGTRAFLMRRTLQNAADSSALAGAAQLDVAGYYSSGGRRVRLDESAAAATAADYVARRGVSAQPSIQATDRHIVVSLRTDLETTFLRLVGINAITVGVTATARPLPGGAP